MKKKHPRRSGKNVSDGRKVKKTNGQSKRRMGNQIARLIDDDEVAVEKDENVKFWRIGSKK